MEHHYAGIVTDLRAGGSECGHTRTSEALGHQDQIAQRPIEGTGIERTGAPKTPTLPISQARETSLAR